MARKTVLVSDMSGSEIPEGKGATIRITFHDARKGVRELDVTDAEAEKLGGRQVARRGRRPKSATRVAAPFPALCALPRNAYERPSKPGTRMRPWVSRSSSGRPRPARSRICSTDISPRSSAIPS